MRKNYFAKLMSYMKNVYNIDQLFTSPLTCPPPASASKYPPTRRSPSRRFCCK